MESHLGFVSIDKTPFEPLDQASDHLPPWKTVFLIMLASGKRRGKIHAFEHARLQRTIGWTQVTLWVGLSFISKTQLVLGKDPKGMLSGTIPALDRHLSNGMAKDRFLCPVRALRFYLEKSMPWREHKRLLFSNQGINKTISKWIRERFLECYTNFHTPLLESHKVKAHQVRAMAALLTFHRQASTEQILRACTWRCHNTFTDFYLKDLSLCSGDLIQLRPVVAAESILHPTGDH